MDIERIGEARYHLGEGPLWDPRESALYWVDSMAPAIWRLDPASGDIRGWDLPGATVGALALRDRGGAVLAKDDGFHMFDFETGACTVIAEVEADDPLTRFNDGKVDRAGRFVAGSLDPKFEKPLGALYRLDADLSWDKLDDGIVCSNGPCWSPDGKTLYFADSSKRTIYAYDYDMASGGVANKRVFAISDAGDPDGATVDAAGYLWSPMFSPAGGAGSVVRFAPDGSVERRIEMPVRFVTSVMFGGAALDELYVTSAGGPVEGATDPSAEAGALFRIRGLGVTGLPETRFAG